MGYAQDYDKLTPKQGELLARIVEAAKEIGGEPLFAYDVSPLGVNVDGPGRSVIKGDWPGAAVAFDVFEQLGFIVRLGAESTFTQFALRKKGLEYLNWRKLPRWRRRLSVAWDSWENDVRGGIITIVTSVGASLLFTLLVNLLFG